MGSSPPSLAWNAAASAAASVVGLFVLFWTNQYLLTRLTPEEFSPYPFVIALTAIFSLLEDFVAAGIGRFAVAGHERDGLRGLERAVWSALPGCLGAAVLLWSIGAYGFFLGADSLGFDAANSSRVGLMLLITFGAQGLALALAPYRIGLYVQEQFVFLSLSRIGGQLLRAALIVSLLVVLGPDVLWVVVGSGAGLLFSASFECVMTKVRLPGMRLLPRVLDRDELWGLLRFNGWGVLGNVAARGADALETLILNAHGTALDVASLHVARLPAQEIGKLRNSAVRVVVPRLVGFFVRDRRLRVRAYFLAGTRYVLWLMLPAFLLLVAFGPDIMVLYAGDTYVVAGFAASVLALRGVVRTGSSLVFPVAIASNSVRLTHAFSLIYLLAHGASCWWLVRELNLGISAVVLSSMFWSTVHHLFCLVPVGASLARIGLFELIAKGLVPGMAPLLLALPACELIFPTRAESWYVLIGRSAVAAVLYVAAWALVCGQGDRRRLGKLIGRVWSRHFGRRR